MSRMAKKKINCFLESISKVPGNSGIDSGGLEVESILEFPGNSEIEGAKNRFICLHSSTMVKH